MPLDKKALSKTNHHNRCSISNLSKDWTGTDEREGVDLHETSGDPLAGTVRDGVAEHNTTGDPLAGMIKIVSVSIVGTGRVSSWRCLQVGLSMTFSFSSFFTFLADADRG